jgi:uncharacterized membrane protein
MSLVTLPHRDLRRSASPAPRKSQATSMEILISQVLRIGVFLAAALIVLGVLLLLIQGAGPGVPSSLTQINAGAGVPSSVSFRSILDGVAHLRAIAVIELGLLVLILTPITRVAMTVVLFAKEHDHTFVAITAIVLLVLVFGFLGLAS